MKGRNTFTLLRPFFQFLLFSILLLLLGSMYSAYESEGNTLTSYPAITTCPNPDLVHVDDILGTEYNELSGVSVSMNDAATVMAIGSPHKDLDNKVRVGRARIFVRANVNAPWGIPVVIVEGTVNRENAGCSVAVSNDGLYVAIGRRGATVTDGVMAEVEHAGAVEIYKIEPGNITLCETLKGEVALGEFGSSVAFSNMGDRLVIGARHENGCSIQKSGVVRVYKRPDSCDEEVDGEWVQVGNDIIGKTTGEELGTTVDISDDGNRIALGAYKYRRSIDTAGVTRVYEYVGGQWYQIGSELRSDGPLSNSGYDVALSETGHRIAVSEYTYDDNKGRVKIFDWNACTMEWSINKTLSNPDLNSYYFGQSVSMTNDGEQIAIGHPLSGNGKVYVYEFCENAWRPVIDSFESESGIQFGHTVFMTNNGTHLIVGHPRYQVINSVGRVQLYKID